ncbi:MAG TPA: Mrp/NBP35 family ATP-binding protein [Nitriliruptorales bacterium]|nr:Mrp/NBP35 family ATP-binding protein [Nitriliruptorales bacterium]
MPTDAQVLDALAEVREPHLERPVTDLGMVGDLTVEDGSIRLELALPIPGSPGSDRLANDVTAALRAVPGVTEVHLAYRAMGEEQRRSLTRRLRAELGQVQGSEVVFARPGSPTKVIAVASGKGGVGKSSVTVNLAVALAEAGHAVGVMDADIYGYSVPRMLGVSGKTYGMEGLVFPLRSYGCKVVSIGFFLPDPDRPVMWRGPMMHRALQQFLSDVYWGELDFLLIDLPPGTGDIAISLGQMLPDADLLVVTTPQEAAQKVAARAGQMAEETGMHVAGVVENMASFTCPDCGSSHDIFGSGGGATLAEELGTQLLARVPIDPRVREGGDRGVPIVVGDPDAPAARALRSVAETVVRRSRSVVGKSLPLVDGG